MGFHLLRHTRRTEGQGWNNLQLNRLVHNFDGTVSFIITTIGYGYRYKIG